LNEIVYYARIKTISIKLLSGINFPLPFEGVKHACIPNAKSIFKEKIRYASSPIDCLKDADCCIIVTEWDEFKKLVPEDFTQNMKHPILINGRRIYNPKEYSQKLEFTAIGLG